MLLNGVLRSGLYALTSVGLALSVGVIGVVNFAHGELLMLGAYLAYWLFVMVGLDPLWALLPGGAMLFGVGSVLYVTGIRRVLKAPELNQMLFTFGVSVFLQNLALILWQGNPRVINVPYRAASLAVGPVSIGVGRLLVFLLAALLVGLLVALLRATRVGKAIVAVGQNRLGAELVGIEVDRVYVLAFGIAAALAGMAGVMLNIVLYAHPLVGLTFTLKAFAIVVLAGLGNVMGALWASLILGVAESAVGTYVPQGTGWADGVFFIVILMALLVRPAGLGGGHR